MFYEADGKDGLELAIGRQLRNSFSRLWPVQISDHSPCTFSRPRSRNFRNPRPCLVKGGAKLYHLGYRRLAARLRIYGDY